jgi:hypothetical protein
MKEEKPTEHIRVTPSLKKKLLILLAKSDFKAMNDLVEAMRKAYEKK